MKIRYKKRRDGSETVTFKAQSEQEGRDLKTAVLTCFGVRLSKCCQAPVRIGGDEREGTHYYVCTKCGEPCDLEASAG